MFCKSGESGGAVLGWVGECASCVLPFSLWMCFMLHIDMYGFTWGFFIGFNCSYKKPVTDTDREPVNQNETFCAKIIVLFNAIQQYIAFSSI